MPTEKVSLRRILAPTCSDNMAARSDMAMGDSMMMGMIQTFCDPVDAKPCCPASDPFPPEAPLLDKNAHSQGLPKVQPQSLVYLCPSVPVQRAHDKGEDRGSIPEAVRIERRNCRFL
jgi:hypothetical protein